MSDNAKVRSVDMVVTAGPQRDRILLVRRGNDPFAGYEALPGGRRNTDGAVLEDAATAAVRELQEETGLTVHVGDLREIDVFAGPDRDPRGWAESTAFAVHLPDAVPVRAGDDTVAAAWRRIDDVDPAMLAFDHAAIIGRALRQR